MMRNPRRNLLLAFACGALLLRADFDPAHWRYRRAISGATPGSPGALVLDRTVYVSSDPALRDLRVVSGNEEIPYVIERVTGSHSLQEISNQVIDQEAVENGVRLTVDTGGGRRHNAIRLATSKTNFRQKIVVETSDDKHDWARVRGEAWIFDFTQDSPTSSGRRISSLTVPYPLSTRRYIRVRVEGWTDPHAITGTWVSVEESSPAVHDEMAVLSSNPEIDPKDRASVFTWDLGGPGIPHDRIAIDTATPAFERAAALETSRDGKDWTFLSSGVLYRFAKNSSLALDFPANHDRWLRLKIFNQDDKPVAVGKVSLLVTRTRLLIKPAATGSLSLYYGGPAERAPSYDLRDLLAREAPAAPRDLTLGPEERNPAYRETPPAPKPWTEQHPALLYSTLVIAVLAMGAVTVLFLKKASAPEKINS